MNIAQMHHAVMIYRTGTFSGAAKSLFMTQSALSKSVSSLEEELGQKIFSRHYHGVVLTPFGEQFIRYADEIISKEKLILDLASGKEDLGKPTFRVSADYLRFASFVYVKIAERHADLLLDLCFVQRNNSGVILELINKAVNLGIIRIFTQNKNDIIQLIDSSGLQYTPIASCSTLISVDSDHPLAINSDDNIISFKELRQYPFRVISEQMDPFYKMQIQYAEIIGADNILEGEFNYNDGSMLLESDAFLCVADMSRAYTRLGLNPLADTGCTSFSLPSKPIDQEIGWVKRKDVKLSRLEEEYLQELYSLCSN